MDIRSIIGGAGLLGLAAFFGLWRWASTDLDRANTALGQQKTITACEAEKTLVASEVAASNAAQIEKLKADVASQSAAIATARAKERLAWQRLSQLKKDIANGSENIPVPDAIERVLDGMRGAFPGPVGAPADRDNEGGNVQPADPGGPQVPTEAAPAS